MRRIWERLASGRIERVGLRSDGSAHAEFILDSRIVRFEIGIGDRPIFPDTVLALYAEVGFMKSWHLGLIRQRRSTDTLGPGEDEPFGPASAV
jgi:hypothetical protein